MHSSPRNLTESLFPPNLPDQPFNNFSLKKKKLDTGLKLCRTSGFNDDLKRSNHSTLRKADTIAWIPTNVISYLAFMGQKEKDLIGDWIQNCEDFVNYLRNDRFKSTPLNYARSFTVVQLQANPSNFVR